MQSSPNQLHETFNLLEVMKLPNEGFSLVVYRVLVQVTTGLCMTLNHFMIWTEQIFNARK